MSDHNNKANPGPLRRFLLIVLLVLLFLGMGGLSDYSDRLNQGGPTYNSSRTSSYSGSESAAISACKKAVRNRLKAPSTAKFSNITAERSGARWKIMGNVDSENSFGAMLRSLILCEVSSSGDASATII